MTNDLKQSDGLKTPDNGETYFYLTYYEMDDDHSGYCDMIRYVYDTSKFDPSDWIDQFNLKIGNCFPSKDELIKNMDSTYKRFKMFNDSNNLFQGELNQ